MPSEYDLKKKLDAWQVRAEVPRDFQRGVWHWIAAREEARRNVWWRQAGEWLATPRYATAVVAVSVLLSLGGAYLHAQDVNARHWRELEARYIESVNPLAQQLIASN